jgi:predicted ATP-dependent endonuclease of OLD family
MQYVFIKNIKKLLGEGIKRDDGINRPLQYIITTHSSHIVADSDFDDIKYLKAITKNDVTAKSERFKSPI